MHWEPSPPLKEFVVPPNGTVTIPAIPSADIAVTCRALRSDTISSRAPIVHLDRRRATRLTPEQDVGQIHQGVQGDGVADLLGKPAYWHAQADICGTTTMYGQLGIGTSSLDWPPGAKAIRQGRGPLPKGSVGVSLHFRQSPSWDIHNCSIGLRRPI
jgi:hypothetical protein